MQSKKTLSLIKKYFSPQKKFQNNIRKLLYNISFVKKGRNELVGNVASVFDIEASSFYDENNEKKCCMYAWTFGLNGKSIRGRTWKEFFEVIDTLVEYYGLNPKKRLIVYIHNLAYEFQWFREYFTRENVFSLENRKVIYAITTNGIEFRCSYLLSGYSLAKLGEKLLTYKVEKKVGDLDYSLIRHSQTELSDVEWDYILYDGLVVMCYIQELLEKYGTITALPITKTGFVRLFCRKWTIQGDNKFSYYRLMRDLTMSEDDYYQLKRTYTGGFTHANINFVGKIIKEVHSFDFASSYPAVMLSEKYPMSKPKFPTIRSEEEFIKYLNNYCCMFDINFHNIKSKVNFENYISRSRCSKIENYVLNNGRVIEATFLQISLTEQDFFIIQEMYEWEYFEIMNFKVYYKDYLPKDFILAILELYKGKTELKGVKGKEYEYAKFKEDINSLYGMCCTDPCRDEIIYEENERKTQKGEILNLVNKYNSNGNRFLSYNRGVWITAYARRNLFKGIMEFKEDYIYSDTDSIKCINIDKHIDFINNYNKEIQEKTDKCLKNYGINKNYSRPKNTKGERKPVGVWDYEGKYDRFKTLGAKRYIYEQNGEIYITIAGVGKSAGRDYLKRKYKTNDKIFKMFKEDLTFPAYYMFEKKEYNGSGKLCHTYIDTFMEGEVIDYRGVKGFYSERSGVHMENTEYTLSLDFEFKNLIMGLKGGHLI